MYLTTKQVYTSYDYAAPLRETREIQDKFKQYKLLTLFTRVSQGLANTVMEKNGTGVAVDSSDIWTWVLKNKESNARFYLAQHNATSSRSVTDFSITVDTSGGNMTIPKLQLGGRQSRWIVTDYSIGKESLLYSSAEVLTYGTFPEPAIVFYLREGQSGQFAFKNSNNVTFTTYGAKTDLNTTSGNGFAYTQTKGLSAVKFSNGVLAYLVDIPTAWTFFAPPTTSNPTVKPDEQVFVFGPYLVRSAKVEGDVVSVIGDNVNSTTIEVYAGGNVSTVSWNGAKLDTKRTAYGSLTARIPGTEDRVVSLPALSDFRVANSLPEASASYDDKNWIVANKTTTLSPVKPLTLPVLFSSDYKFFTGAKIYRGYFNGRNVTSANITAQGGVAAGWNAWVNGKFVGYHPGDAALQSTTGTLDFKNVNLTDKNNVLTVVTDYTGHDETSTGPSGVQNPRGLLGAQLQGGAFTQWKIQGNAGGEKNIDPVRGPMNEGGLLGERLGWHLPGFDTSSWAQGSPVTDGVAGAGIKWFTTTFDLNIDEDLDVPLGVEVDAPSGTVARVLIYVNGYQYGKFVPHIGPQKRFPIPPGIINMRGSNTLGIALWSQTEAGAKLSTLQLIQYGKYQSGFGFNKIDSKALQPAWEDRSQYA